MLAEHRNNRRKFRRNIKAVKQYLTRKEWRKGEQSCSLEELQKKTHRTKKGLRERKRKREKQKNIEILAQDLNIVFKLYNSLIIRKLRFPTKDVWKEIDYNN